MIESCIRRDLTTLLSEAVKMPLQSFQFLQTTYDHHMRPPQYGHQIHDLQASQKSNLERQCWHASEFITPV